MTIWILQKLEGFVWKRGSFALQKPFLLSITTKRSCRHITIGDRKRGTILGRMEISRPIHRKAKILWQLENLQNYKDLYGKPLERDWRAKRLLLIQILLISNAHKNSPFKRYKAENLHVSLFGTVLSISDNIMHYQWLISVFLKNTSRDQLLQKAYCKQHEMLHQGTETFVC